MESIGLIAGNRNLPLLVARGARAQGARVIALAIKGETSPDIRKCADKVYWIKVSEFSRLFLILKQEGLSRAIMAGQISPRRLFSKEILRDEELRTLLEGIRNKKADTIFGAIAARLQSEGITLLDSSLYVKDYMPQAGILTRTTPNLSLREDIQFGLSLAKSVAGLDIGQTVAVKDTAVIAVEAFEGTDNLIRRAGHITRGITVVKVSKPKQDMRFDIPVVGMETVKTCIGAGARCLAIEADKTIFMDREKACVLADRQRFVITAV